MLQKKGNQPKPSTAIQPREGCGPCSLSYAQERIWFFEQLEPGTPAYNIPAAVRLAGALQLEALRQALSEILRRHEALRTVFRIGDDGPVQITAPNPRLALRIVDLRNCAQACGDDELLRMARQEIERPFDLSIGPLLRCCLWQLDGEFVALVITHHIASDGWSLPLLFGEMAALYEAFSNGRPSPLPSLTVQYADFAQWQREWLQGEVLERQLSYWKSRVGDAPTVPSIKTDHARASEQTFRGAKRSVVLPHTLLLSLKKLSRDEGVTLFMLMLAAFETLLYRYTWQEDVIVGTPIANRNRPETEGLIGFFVNTLVLRTDLGGNPQFRELLGRVRETALGAYAHQDLPFDQLVDALQTKRGMQKQPLFQVFFALNNNRASAFDLPGITTRPLAVDNGVAKFDIEMSLVERDDSLIVAAIYNADLFEETTINLLLERYERCVREVAADPLLRLLDIPLSDDCMTDTDTGQVFVSVDEFDFE
jgi:aspartate racemase